MSERISEKPYKPHKINVCKAFLRVPGGARFLRVQVPNPPGSGKDIAEGKGVAGDCKSEGSRMWGTY